jgi:hypothetical protein
MLCFLLRLPVRPMLGVLLWLGSLSFASSGLVAHGRAQGSATRAKVKVAVLTGGVDADLKALRAALAKLPSVKFSADEVKFSDFKRDGGLFVEPFFIEFTDLAKTDAGEIARTIAGAKLTKNDGGLYLFMKYRPDSIDTKQLRAALGKVKGVRADKSWAGDANIWVHVDGSGQGKLAEIARAMHGAGAKFRDPITDIDP